MTFKPPIKSPFVRNQKPQALQPAFGEGVNEIIKIAQELSLLKESLTKKVDSKLAETDAAVSKVDDLRIKFERKIGELFVEIQRVKAIRIVGEKGDAGYTPVKGKDYRDGKDASPEDVVPLVLSRLPKIKNGRTPVRGIDYYTQKDVQDIVSQVSRKIDRNKKDVSIDPMAILDEALKNPKAKQKIKTEHVDGLEQTLSALRNQLARGYLHGGGDTVRAGSNITITRNADGTTTISSSGGSANITTESITGTQSGENVEFDLSSLSNPFVAIQFVTREGQFLNALSVPPSGSENGWIRSGDTLTVYNASAGENFAIQYTY